MKNYLTNERRVNFAFMHSISVIPFMTHNSFQTERLLRNIFKQLKMFNLDTIMTSMDADARYLPLFIAHYEETLFVVGKEDDIQNQHLSEIVS